VCQAFLKTFLIDSPYKTPIQNTVELFTSGAKRAYSTGYKFILEIGEEWNYQMYKVID